MTGRWRKITQGLYPAAELFLREREAFCVGACSRFLALNQGHDHVWGLQDSYGELKAFLIHSRHSLYPVFGEDSKLPLPGFLERFLRKVPPHSVQGLRSDTEILEAAMESLGFGAEERIDYDLMTLDSNPPAECFCQGPPGLVLRKPLPQDIEGLYQLQAAYEREEVIPPGGTFSLEASRKTLEKILADQEILAACLDNQVVGKVNTNAVSFTRCQIGGVYVRPEYRGRGIALKMSAAFLRELITVGRGISLYVKKRNAPARKVYTRLGFTRQGDYRISYY